MRRRGACEASATLVTMGLVIFQRIKLWVVDPHVLEVSSKFCNKHGLELVPTDKQVEPDLSKNQ